MTLPAPEIETKTSLSASTIAQRRKFETSGLILLALAAIGFILVPHAEDIHPSGTWFDLGWPLPTASVRVGLIELPNHFGLQPYFDPTGSFNVVVWVAIFFGIRWLARDPRVPGHILKLTRFLIMIAACIGGAWLSYGIFKITSLIIRH